MSSPAMQFLIQSLYQGDIIYRPASHRSFVPDTYKTTPVEYFDVSKRPALDHYVLRIPQVRRYIEFGTFLVLVILFMLLQQSMSSKPRGDVLVWLKAMPHPARDKVKLEPSEVLFIIWSFGFALEEATALRERGATTYFRQLWNVLDAGFCSEQAVLRPVWQYIDLTLYFSDILGVLCTTMHWSSSTPARYLTSSLQCTSCKLVPCNLIHRDCGLIPHTRLALVFSFPGYAACFSQILSHSSEFGRCYRTLWHSLR